MIPQTSQHEAYLAPGVHMAWRDEDVVVLDLKADTYGCLVGLASSVRPGASAGTLLISEPELLDQLSLAGLTASTGSDHDAVQTVCGELEPWRVISSTLKLGAAITAVVSTARFRRTPLTDLVAIVRARNDGLPSSDRHTAALALGAYLSVHPWIPYAGDCLQRAFMLHAQLHAHGVAAQWVFGVRTWPFAAHCWIQIGDLVLGDSLDRVKGFTPILRV